MAAGRLIAADRVVVFGEQVRQQLSDVGAAGDYQRTTVKALQTTGPRSAAAGRDAHSRRTDTCPRRAEPPRARPRRPLAP
jgi:hypothetical protein